MCGIVGLVGLTRSVAEGRVRTALHRLRHRGPDGQGLHAADGVVLGMRRLAIIDLVGGQQPIYDETRRIAVVCNGEIYNYIELFHELERRGHVLQSRSDINVIPHLYQERGRDMMVPCRGMFAGALWDERIQSLLLVRDRAGKKPLFWAQVREGLAFASELPALIALLDAVPCYDMLALRDYLQLGVVPHPRTIYKNVHALPPGCTLTFVPGGDPSIEAYWSVTQPREFTGSRDEALARVESHLLEAVKLRLRSDVPVGLFLSGGIDSGLVASFAAEAGARDLLAFVVEVEGELNEAPAAMEVASRLGLPAAVVPLRVAPLEALDTIPTMFGQPFADSSAVPSFFVARAAGLHRKVVLNGDGGDELFAGYRRYQIARLGALIPKALGPAATALGGWLARHGSRRSSAGFAARLMRGLAVRDPARYLVWTTDLFDEPALAHCFPDLAILSRGLSELEQLRGYQIKSDGIRHFMQTDFRLNLADDLMVKMDIATMANSLEARSPFLDIPLAEFAWSLPAHVLVGGAETKPLLRSLARRRLPGSIPNAPKRGFEVPLSDWLRGPLRDVVEDTLAAGDSRVAALGDVRALRQVIRLGSAFAGNWAATVWALLMLELFLRAPAPVAGE